MLFQRRFSQRQILLNYPSASDIVQFVSASLFLPGTDANTKKWNSAVRRIVLSPEFTSLVEEQSLLFPLSFHILPSSLPPPSLHAIWVVYYSTPSPRCPSTPPR